MCEKCRTIECVGRTAEDFEGERVSIRVGPHGDPIFIRDDNSEWEIWRDPIYESLWFAPVSDA